MEYSVHKLTEYVQVGRGVSSQFSIYRDGLTEYIVVSATMQQLPEYSTRQDPE